MGETSQAAGPGLPSSPSPPPPSPRSACSLGPTVGKGTPRPGGDITGHLTFSLLSVTLLVSFGSSMLYGYNLAVVNSPAVHIKAFYNATWSQRYGHELGPGPLTLLYSLTVSIFALGGLVGSLLVGVLVKQYGRNGALSRSALLVLLAGGFMGFSRELGSPEMVIIGRTITGLHSGICLSVVPLYLGEISPKNLRGFLGLMPSIFICLGVFAAQVLSLPELLGKDRFWPLLLSVVVVPASLQLLLLHCFPESPRYLLIERNDVCGATKGERISWRRLALGHAGCFSKVFQDQALHRFLGTPDVQDVIEEMKEEQRSLSSMEMVSVWQLLRDHSVRWQTLSVVVVNAGMQLSGIDAIWFYTNIIFENAGIPVSQIPYTTVGTGAVEVFAGLIGPQPWSSELGLPRSILPPSAGSGVQGCSHPPWSSRPSHQSLLLSPGSASPSRRWAGGPSSSSASVPWASAQLASPFPCCCRLPCPGCATSALPAWSASSLASAWDQPESPS
ncbi:solute carrier family 2, facilitated glucose transporter member 9-like isoform X5 [Pithys albifrons albifrons]|uniref:solute carrier family 2, facilitated glucose transporter member 9-like isoform X5 n=1 Tax=Pithys albifrons albifrons TaxID=3385563 RepID=UPI003A5D1C5B